MKPNYRLITLKITSDRSGLHQRKHLLLCFRRLSGRVIWVTHTELYNYLCALVTRTFLNFLISYFYFENFYSYTVSISPSFIYISHGNIIVKNKIKRPICLIFKRFLSEIKEYCKEMFFKANVGIKKVFFSFCVWIEIICFEADKIVLINGRAEITGNTYLFFLLYLLF